MTGRYVLHERVLDYLKLGWCWRAYVNDHAALMMWLCDCPMVEPETR